MVIGVIRLPRLPHCHRRHQLLSAALTSLPVTAAAEGRPDGLTVHFLPGRHFPRRCQGARGPLAARALDEAEESMERGMMKK